MLFSGTATHAVCAIGALLHVDGESGVLGPFQDVSRRRAGVGCGDLPALRAVGELPLPRRVVVRVARNRLDVHLVPGRLHRVRLRKLKLPAGLKFNQFRLFCHIWLFFAE